MNGLSIRWTDQMRHVLMELQQRRLLQRLSAFAEQGGVSLYVVGGTLRDICLGRPTQDVDLAMRGDVMGFAERLANHLGAAYVPMDAERGEARVVYRKREIFDFARLQGDTIIADLHRRDFTINAMACPLARLLTRAAPEIIDPYGGWHDLRARRMRMVSRLSFVEDPLRLLRAFRFAANLDFTLDPVTLAAMETVTPRLRDAAAERIHSELLKLFAAPSSSPHLVTMARLGLLDVLFPELAATRGLPYRPGDPLDVFEHSTRTYQAVEDLVNAPGSRLPDIAEAVIEYVHAEGRQALVKWAALLHAIGKSPKRGEAVQAEGADHVYPKESAVRWEHIGSRLKLSRQRTEYVKTVIAQHRRPFELAALEAQARLTLRLIYQWSQELGDDMLGVFLLAVGKALVAERADTPVRGALALQRCAARVWEVYRGRILPVTTGPRLVTGDDLQQIFRLTPGPRFKTLLEALEVARVEGRVRTRAEALQWVEEQLTMP